ncbi:hypothetical protein EYF80_041373 [Liparis tanakae]|uniref:Uncharacterized protein n=1 Tax=Liparis tanakae TaxID=230148 RepID=A0A4Z2G4F7_9TELE|nr:hypothetical protein EYF80_041373 [Liparis tanakae]
MDSATSGFLELFEISSQVCLSARCLASSSESGERPKCDARQVRSERGEESRAASQTSSSGG